MSAQRTGAYWQGFILGIFLGAFTVGLVAVYKIESLKTEAITAGSARINSRSGAFEWIPMRPSRIQMEQDIGKD